MLIKTDQNLTVVNPMVLLEMERNAGTTVDAFVQMVSNEASPETQLLGNGSIIVYRKILVEI